MRVENKSHTNAHRPLTSLSTTKGSIPPLRQSFIFSGLESFLRHFLRNSSTSAEKVSPRSIQTTEEFQWQSSASTNTFAQRKAGVTAKPRFIRTARIKPNVVVVCGVEEKHTEGRYFLNFNNQWIDVGEDAPGAQRKRLLRLNQIEYERLSGTSLLASPVGRPTVVEFSGRKVIKDEVEAYLADLELTRRPARTVQSKRKYLGDFLGLIGKKFADEYRREDVLKYKNRLQDKGFEPKTIDTRVMAVVTLFNRWLKIKLGLDAKDWPETHEDATTRDRNSQCLAIDRVYERDEVLALLRSLENFVYPASAVAPAIRQVRYSLFYSHNPIAGHSIAELACRLNAASRWLFVAY